MHARSHALTLVRTHALCTPALSCKHTTSVALGVKMCHQVVKVVVVILKVFVWWTWPPLWEEGAHSGSSCVHCQSRTVPPTDIAGWLETLIVGLAIAKFPKSQRGSKRFLELTFVLFFCLGFSTNEAQIKAVCEAVSKAVQVHHLNLELVQL